MVMHSSPEEIYGHLFSDHCPARDFGGHRGNRRFQDDSKFATGVVTILMRRM